MPLAHQTHTAPPSAPTLLLLHGVTRNHRDWAPILPELTHHWGVIALDHAGHGASPRTPGAYRVADYTRQVANFLRANFPAPPVIFGHSLGAMVALGLAADGLAAAAILEDPPFHTMGRDIAATPYRAQFAGMQTVAQRGGDLETMTNALADIRLPGPHGETRLGDLRDRDSLRFSAECLAQVDPEIFTPLIAGQWLEGFDHEAAWPQTQCPLLLLQADPAAGGALTDADAQFAELTAPQCRLIRFPGIGHQIHRSSPAHVAAVLRQWARDFSISPSQPSSSR
jgi:pimeloyl-ACP methyl ester carboxylesterase